MSTICELGESRSICTHPQATPHTITNQRHHRNLNSTRYPIPDVPVVYLVEPTAANIQVIANDLSRGLYTPAYVNFLSSVPRPLLEDFASQIATSGAAEHIAQVYDQYLNFIVAEPDLFSLGLGNDAYWKINSAQTSDEDLDVIVDKIVNGLFSVSVTMGMFRSRSWKPWTLLTSSFVQVPCPSSGVRKAELPSSLRPNWIENSEIIS